MLLSYDGEQKKCEIGHLNHMILINMNRIFISCFLFALLIGCTLSPSKNEIVPQTLQHVTIEIPDMILGSPGGIQKLGDGLLIMDYKSDSMFHYVDLKHKKYVGQFGSKGQGPDEFIHLTSLQPYSDKTVCGYDLMKREIKILKWDSLNNRINGSTRKKWTDAWAFDVVPYGQNQFVGNGCFKDSIFAAFDSLGNITDLAGEYPYRDENERKISVRNRALAYQGTLRVTPKGRLAFATMCAKILFLYEIHDNRLRRRKVVIDSYADYKPDYSGGESSYTVVHNGNLPVCYRDLSVTESRIYALYSGRSFKEYGLAEWECGYIYVYDWEGNLQTLYQLELPLLCFCVDELSGCIYGIANVPEPTLVCFHLPSDVMK